MNLRNTESSRKSVLSATCKVNLEDTVLFNLTLRMVSSQHTRRETIGRSMAEKLSLTLKKVLFIINLGRTLLNWRPRRFGGGDGGKKRMTRAELL